VLSPAIGLFCHRHRRNCFRQLDAGVEASGPHDFAVRKKTLSSVALLTSTASRPASVTIASRPSSGTRRPESIEMICPTGITEYFCKEDSTRVSSANEVICPSGKSNRSFRQQTAAVREPHRRRPKHDGYRFAQPILRATYQRVIDLFLPFGTLSKLPKLHRRAGFGCGDV
jgi:hypothetical protein